jgi:hypothetical protein
MNRTMLGMMFVGTLLALGCEEKKEPAPAPTASAKPTEAKPAETKPAAVALSDDDISVAADFEEEATKSITTASYKAELDAMDKEIK